MTGVVVESAPILVMSTINQLVTTTVQNPFTVPEDDVQNVVLNAGEGLVIQAFNTVVGGIGLHGIIQCCERA
jgi:hypothetical protein